MSGLEDPIKRHAKALFEKIIDPWPGGDLWGSHTKRTIATFIARHACDAAGETRSMGACILNVGSHGNSYSLKADHHFHVDIAEKSMRHVSLACVADVEHLPFPDDAFDVVLCVGSVINYCVAAQAISELSRVLKSKGQLLLEFETSDSLEFLLTGDLAKDVAIVRTFYDGALENVYVYSKKYITSALAANGLTIKAAEKFHIISPLVYRISRNERAAAVFSRLDRFASNLPAFKNYSANIFIAAQKA